MDMMDMMDMSFTCTFGNVVVIKELLVDARACMKGCL
jgi:hypothetical protein